MTELFTGPLFERLALTLIHFLWQGALVAFGFVIILRLLRPRTATARYGIALGAFVVLAACPAATFLALGSQLPGGRPELARDSGPVRDSAGRLESRDSETPEPELKDRRTSAPPYSTVAPEVFTWSKLQDGLRGFRPAALIGWMAGVAALSARILLAAAGIRSLLRKSVPAPPRLIDRGRCLTLAIGVRKAPRLLLSRESSDASAMGFFRPAIVIPASWITLLPPETIEAAIAHELAHLRRLDLWVNLFQRVIETLLFYHPAIWWISNRLRIEREMCCDGIAAAALREPAAYAEALERLARLALEARPAGLALGWGDKQKRLLDRIQNVLGLHPAPQVGSSWMAGALGLGLLIGFCAVIATVRAGEVKEAGGIDSGKAASSPILNGLRWLARHQEDDGHWSSRAFSARCQGASKCSGGAQIQHDTGVTALAAIAFLRAGHLPDSTSTFAGPVKKALGWLTENQTSNGCFLKEDGEYMYDHAIAALALSEATLLTKSTIYKESAQRGIDFLVKAQNPGFAWRYEARKGDNDTSVTGWCIQALDAAEAAGLQFDRDVYQGVKYWINRMTNNSGGVGYVTPGDSGSYIMGINEKFQGHPTMTAAGLCMKIVMDKHRDDPWLKAAAMKVVKDLPAWDEKRMSIDFNYWHHGAMALARFDGPKGPGWTSFKDSLDTSLAPHQDGEGGGCSSGSWSPLVDKWGPAGGRVYATAINVLTLELIDKLK